MTRELRSFRSDRQRSEHQAGCTAETSECQFWTWGVDHVRPACCTQHLTELLFFVEDLLDRHEIFHWLDFGTLLGAVRDEQLIPWDVDVDMGAPDTELDAIVALAAEIEEAGYGFDTSHLDCIRIYYSAHNRLKLDIVPWQEHDGWLRPIVRWAGDWPGMAGRTDFPRSYLNAPGTVTLYGKAFPAPAPLDRFLSEHRYGPDYLTPRRQIVNEKLYEGIVSSDDLTPEAAELLDRAGDAERRLNELGRSPLSRFRPWRLWSKSGLPIRPDERRLERLRDSLTGAEVTPAVEKLVRSLALLEQAIDELERPRPGNSIRRSYRRLVRASEGLRARLAGRPHRAGFPFGI